MPQGWAFILSRPGALVLGILLYFVLGFRAASLVERPGFGLATAILLVTAVGLLVVTVVRDHRTGSASADAYAIVRLLHVIDMAQAHIDDPVRRGGRHRLARAIHDAETFVGYAYPPRGKLPRRHRRTLARQARGCAAALRSYVDVAMRGDVGAVRHLQEDFARAILRIGSGNWSQVAELNPAAGSKRSLRDFVPQVPAKDVLTFVAAVGAATATIVKAVTG
jgi:hypothetical protein